jgi:uncharacterized membrane protein
MTFLLFSLYYVLFKSLISKVINISKKSDILGAFLVFFIILVIKTVTIIGLTKFVDSQKTKSVSDTVLNIVLIICIIVITISIMFLFQYVSTRSVSDSINNSNTAMVKEVSLSNELNIIKSTATELVNNCGIYIIGISLVYIFLLILTQIYDFIINNKYEKHKNKQRILFHSICYCLIAIYLCFITQ